MRYGSCTEFVTRLEAALAPESENPTQSMPALPLRAEPAAGEVKVNEIDGQRYVWIPPGTFQMGCSPGDSECYDDEKPAHEVTITRGFWMGQTPVTVGAYRRYLQAAGLPLPEASSDDSLPVVDVTWEEASRYCEWAGVRLPTEAEWEYAARAGTTGARYGNLDDIAWHYGNSGGSRKPVGQKQANAFGLFDMLGNVWEWTADWYDEEGKYRASEDRDPKGPAHGTERMLRGGGWLNLPRCARASYRLRNEPAFLHLVVGFRCGGN